MGETSYKHLSNLMLPKKLEAKPETQTAKWILIRKVETRDIDDGSIERYNITNCSNCGHETTRQTPFCPMCGFKMENDNCEGE